MRWDAGSLLGGVQLGDAGFGRVDCGVERPERRRRLDVRGREHALGVAVVGVTLVLLDGLRVGRWERRRGPARTTSRSLADTLEIEQRGVQSLDKLLKLLRGIGVNVNAVLDLLSCAALVV
jgi:hypothetical protein